MSILFGGKAPQINPTSVVKGFSSPGISATAQGGSYNLSQSPAMAANIGGLQSTFGQAAGAFQQLGQTVAPGFSQLRQAGLAQLESGKSAAVSNLRDSLAQRRMLGSSFANASISGAQATYDQAKADFAAQSYLSELDASMKTTAAQYTAATQAFQVGLSQMNFESSLAAQLQGQATSAMTAISQANLNAQMQQAQANATSMAGAGKLLGTVGAIGLAPFTGGLSLAALPVLAGGGGGFGGGGLGYGGYSGPQAPSFSSGGYIGGNPFTASNYQNPYGDPIFAGA